MVFLIGSALRTFFSLYLLAFFIRAVMSWVPIINPGWSPTNPALIRVLNLIYRITEPPLRWVGRYVRPLHFGGIGIDLSFVIVILGLMVLSKVVLRLWYWLAWGLL